MDLIVLVLVLALVGFLVWVITTRIPMDPMIKLAIQIIALIVIILYVLRRFGGLPNVM
jgi:uncharacterized membrane protein